MEKTIKTQSGPTCHDLKTWPEFFEAIKIGNKTFEVRYNDRDFKLGDYLRLKEYDPEADKYTGREIVCRIQYILHGGQFGVEGGYCVLSLHFSPYHNLLFSEPKH